MGIIGAMEQKKQSLQMESTRLLQIGDDDIRCVYQSIHKSKRAIVLTGAGISCNAGIPDFRSSDGLYNMTANMSKSIKGKDLFDISLFNSHETISNFAMFMSNLYSETLKAKPTLTHEFISQLSQENKLIRCYTQNIDGLESKLGMRMDFDQYKDTTILKTWKNLDVIQLHGDLNTLSCTACYKTAKWNIQLMNSLSTGELPDCPYCIEKRDERIENGKRDTGSIGRLRPNIVLYGENHPFSEIITTGLNSDLKTKPDVFLIMGTSLKVHGVKALVKSMSQAVHSRNGIVILVNKDKLTGWNGIIDYQIQSDCDQFINKYQEYQKSSIILQTPPSTPKKLCRIRDLLNTPSPQKKKKQQQSFCIHKDSSSPKSKFKSKTNIFKTPEESPKRSPRKALKNIELNLNKTPQKERIEALHDYGDVRRSPRISRIQNLLNDV